MCWHCFSERGPKWGLVPGGGSNIEPGGRLQDLFFTRLDCADVAQTELWAALGGSGDFWAGLMESLKGAPGHFWRALGEFWGGQLWEALRSSRELLGVLVERWGALGSSGRILGTSGQLRGEAWGRFGEALHSSCELGVTLGHVCSSARKFSDLTALPFPC